MGLGGVGVTMSATILLGRKGQWGTPIRQDPVLCSATPATSACSLWEPPYIKSMPFNPQHPAGPTQQRISAFKILKMRPHHPTQRSFQGPHSCPHPQKSFYFWTRPKLLGQLRSPFLSFFIKSQESLVCLKITSQDPHFSLPDSRTGPK